jgi:hypothetical protein
LDLNDGVRVVRVRVRVDFSTSPSPLGERLKTNLSHSFF